MKQSLFIFIFLFSQYYLFASDYDFSALHGLQNNKKDIYFEISGYDIFCSTLKGKLNDSKTITKFKKQYKIKDIQANYSDTKLPLPNLIIETENPLKKNPAIKYNEVFYLFAKTENEIKYIVFRTLNQRDILLENEFANAFLEEKLTDFISDNWTGTSISFAGRTLHLGTDCRWISPHNLHFRGGQISWSEFSSAESAEFDIDARIAANSVGALEILLQESLDIIFEDIPSVAFRVVYKEKYWRFPLIVYYITQEVRGRYLSCTMSNYGYNRNDYDLHTLLQQFMSIPFLPEGANNSFDVPELESYESYPNAWYMPNFQISLGTVIPMGNLSHVFQYAPSFDIRFAVPIRQKMSIDLGLMFSFPVKNNMFDYAIKDEIFETKATNLICGNLSYRYNQTINKNISLSPYLGIGFASISTDIEKETNNNNKNYYSVDAFDMLGGIQVKYKKVGCFVEVHKATFPNSSKVANTFGSSFFYTGLTYYFKAN